MLSRKLKKFIIKTKIRWYNFVSKIHIPNNNFDGVGHEGMSTAWCRKMIIHPKSYLIQSTKTDKRYIRNKDLEIYITLDDNLMEITNNSYHDVVRLSVKQMNKLNKHFDTKIEKLVAECDSQMKNNMIKHMSNVYNQIN